jgi:mannose-6-phosphate isomerase-like protein (cupin superfamily)
LTVPVAAAKLPGMMNATTTSPYIPTAQTGAAVLAPGEGELLTVRGNRLAIKVASERQSVFDYTAPAGFPGPPLHIHPGFDEVFLVLEGHLTVRVGDEVSRLDPGSLAFVPGPVPHTFANIEAEPVRFLLLCAPGGFEDYFRAVAVGDDAAMAEAEHRVGYTPVGHPDDDR